MNDFYRTFCFAHTLGLLVNKMTKISKKGQNLPKLSKIQKNSSIDLWIHLYDSNNFNVFSCWKVVIFPNKILEFSSLWLCSLSQAAQRPVIRFDEGSNHGSDCRRWWDYDLLLCVGKQSLPIESTIYILGQYALSACYLLGWTCLNWFMDRLSRAKCTVHLISAQTSQQGIKCTKAKV